MSKIIDISSSKRVGVLTRLMEEMGTLTDPREAMDVFAAGMRQAYDPLSAVYLSTVELRPGEYRISRLVTADGVDHVPWSLAWDYRMVPVQSGGLLSELVGAGGPRIMHELDLSDDPVLGGVVGGNRSLAAVPVLDPKMPINWIVLLHPDPAHFGVQELEQHILRANLMGAVSKGLWVSQQLEAANQQIAREIEQIARIQRTLLPAQLPQIPGLAIAAHYATFDRAGGDLYDCARLEADPTTP